MAAVEEGDTHRHLLSRPRPHARLRHGPQGRDGRAHRAARRLFQGQGRLDAHVLAREEFLRRARHRRRPGADRHRPRLRAQISRQRPRQPHLPRRRRDEPGPGLRELQHGGAVEAAGRLCHREQQIRHGHLGDARLGLARSVHPRRALRHSRPPGRRHERRRGARGGRGGGGLCALGQGPLHPGDADLSLSRPFDVRSGEIPQRATR